jgi:hypothetical protein
MKKAITLLTLILCLVIGGTTAQGYTTIYDYPYAYAYPYYAGYYGYSSYYGYPGYYGYYGYPTCQGSCEVNYSVCPLVGLVGEVLTGTIRAISYPFVGYTDYPVYPVQQRVWYQYTQISYPTVQLKSFYRKPGVRKIIYKPERREGPKRHAGPRTLEHPKGLKTLY